MSPRKSTLQLAASLRASVVPLGRALRKTDSGLTPTQLSVLGAIYRNGPTNMTALAERERLSPAMTSKVVQVLVEEGLVERTRDEHDRRICLVRIGATGERWIDETHTKHDSWLAERLSTLNAEQRQTLKDAVPLLEALVDDTR